MTTLHVGIDSWIIQDGNYPDYRVGEASSFALEFYPQSLRASHERSLRRERLFGSHYRITGKVVFVAKQVWVIDFGFLAFQNQAPPRVASKGQWIHADIYLGIDPIFYFESLYSLPGMPSLKYEFRVREIQLETTPRLTSRDEHGRTSLKRGESRRSFQPVPEADAWKDDDGHGVRIDRGLTGQGYPGNHGY